MWSIALSVVIVSLIGAFAHQAQRTALAEDHASVAALAEDMAIYRGAVLRHFSAHDEQRDTGVDLATLRAEGALRDWSTLPVGQWNNYRAPDGTIYVYATAPLAGDIGAALARQARNSLMAGTYRKATGTLYAPENRGAEIPLAALLARRELADGAPVWLAAAR